MQAQGLLFDLKLIFDSKLNEKRPPEVRVGVRCEFVHENQLFCESEKK